MSEAGALRDQGIAAFRAGRVEDAIRLLRQAVAADAQDHRAYSVLGAAFVQRGDISEAISAFENARRIRPDAANIHYNLGLAYQRAGQLNEAIAAFRAAVEVDPSYDKAKEALGRAQAAAGERPGAAEAPAPPPSAPAAERKMPSAPPPAPWQTTPPGAPAAGAGQDFVLRPLGGDQAPPKPAESAPPASASRPAPVTEGPRARQQAPRSQAFGRQTARARPADSAKTEYDRLGIKSGIGYGILYTIGIVILDRYIEPASVSLTYNAGLLGFGRVFLAAIIFGAIWGAVIGLGVARVRSVNGGIAVGAALGALVGLFMASRPEEKTFGSVLRGGIMGAGYGLIVGYFIGRRLLEVLRCLSSPSRYSS